MPDSFKHQLIRQRRDYLEMSRLDIVKRLYEKGLDISEFTLNSWEDGETTPDADHLPVLADVLKCKVHDFYA